MRFIFCTSLYLRFLGFGVQFYSINSLYWKNFNNPSFSDNCTDTTVFSLDSFNIKAITNNAVIEINNTERTVNISLWTVPPKIPVNAGSKINPRLDNIDNLPKFCAYLKIVNVVIF